MTTRRFQTRARSGMALMLVIPAVAVAAVLAYAVLANTGTQDQISANSNLLAQTDCLAESGINYAMFNLQNPLLAPPSVSTYWPGTTAPISLGGSTGTVVITVSNYGPGAYQITSSATAASPFSISRTMTAIVQLTVPAVPVNQAIGLNGLLTLGPSAIVHIVGDLNDDAAVVLNSLSSLLGALHQSLSTNTVPASPTSLTSYVLNGVSYSAKLLTTSPTAGTVLGPTTTNPAGIYYYGGSALSLNGVTINGTLYAPNTTITVTGSAANTITAPAQFPALVAKQLSLAASGKQLTANGLVWLNTGIAGVGTGSSITVNGSLLAYGASAINSSFAGTLNLNYVANNVNVPNFSTMPQTPTSIKVVSWGQ